MSYFLFWETKTHAFLNQQKQKKTKSVGKMFNKLSNKGSLSLIRKYSDLLGVFVVVVVAGLGNGTERQGTPGHKSFYPLIFNSRTLVSVSGVVKLKHLLRLNLMAVKIIKESNRIPGRSVKLPTSTNFLKLPPFILWQRRFWWWRRGFCGVE